MKAEEKVGLSALPFYDGLVEFAVFFNLLQLITETEILAVTL